MGPTALYAPKKLASGERQTRHYQATQDIPKTRQVKGAAHKVATMRGDISGQELRKLTELKVAL